MLKLINTNKKASFEYFIIEKYEAGIELIGTEVKAIREKTCQIAESYIQVKNNEMYIFNMNIPEYTYGNIFNHEATRVRKLLMHKKEILKLRDKLEIEGYTLVPIKLYFKGSIAKILIGLAKGKKNYDKRESIKKKDMERQVAKDLKYL